jgi:Domain of unknown function (DUF3883)
MAIDWSREEVEAVTADYIAMLLKELRREPYNKTAHRRQLSSILANRSNGSIERKHQNISAILISLGHPYISGYKPLGNYQLLLAEVVTGRVSTDQMLAATVSESVSEPARVPSVADILSRLESPPQSTPFVYPRIRDRKPARRRFVPPVNYLEREARNASLGRAGEEFAMNYERARLIRLSKDHLADRVEHIALVEDGRGFDIHSFEAEGRDRLIEVKTTAYGKQTPFFVSRNEVAVSREEDKQYHIYRLFEFRDNAKLYTINGALERICQMEAMNFAARPK